MSGAALGRMDLQPVPVHPQLAIAPEVMAAAATWRMFAAAELGATYLRCWKCGQSVMIGASFTLGELTMCVLAHLMQAHGWTREEPGND
jgi:hypothetical protein